MQINIQDALLECLQCQFGDDFPASNKNQQLIIIMNQISTLLIGFGFFVFQTVVWSQTTDVEKYIATVQARLKHPAERVRSLEVGIMTTWSFCDKNGIELSKSGFNKTEMDNVRYQIGKTLTKLKTLDDWIQSIGTVTDGNDREFKQMRNDVKKKISVARSKLNEDLDHYMKRLDEHDKKSLGKRITRLKSIRNLYLVEIKKSVTEDNRKRLSPIISNLEKMDSKIQSVESEIKKTKDKRE